MIIAVPVLCTYIIEENNPGQSQFDLKRLIVLAVLVLEERWLTTESELKDPFLYSCRATKWDGVRGWGKCTLPACQQPNDPTGAFGVLCMC